MSARGVVRSVRLMAAALLLTASLFGRASQIDLYGPAGSGAFGTSVTVLSNGNFVVTDPLYSISGGATNVGAVYLYDGTTLAVISKLTGSAANDIVGNGGVTVLSNGNYLVYSGSWDNGAASDAGAVTWCSCTSGLTGVVSAANSLVGGQTNDYVGSGTTTVLPNGNYVVLSPGWHSGTASYAGAATWGDGLTGVTGVVSAANSLVGRMTNDNVAAYGVAVLANGNYVVRSYNWNNGSTSTVGAVTWGSGSSGVKGVVSVTNSLVGTTAGDQVGAGGITALSNGNYVVRSQYWQNGGVFQVGAVTWANGVAGTKGRVSATNSLIGSTSSDKVGSGSVTALVNGNYVVRSPNWDRGLIADVGAVTWGSGVSGITGLVSAANSLVGSNSLDQVGSAGALVLANGNYVVRSPYWDRGGVSDAGAATWCSGASGSKGVVSATNSLVGSLSGDMVGLGALALANGSYVVLSPYWDNGAAADVGAATWRSGVASVTGEVTVANSLVGSAASDRVGVGGATALAGGDYVVLSPNWDNGSLADAGAATWGSGAGGLSGLLSAANSLLGGSAGDQIGSGGATALSNGSYVVCSPKWMNGAAANAGAVTWGAAAGVAGPVSAANSLVGSSSGDGVGSVAALANGNYVVCSPNWDGAVMDAGAVTWGSGNGGTVGAVSAANSLVGSAAGDQVGGYGATALANGNYVLRNPFWDNGATANAGAVLLAGGASDASGAITAANGVLGDVAGAGSSMNFSFDAWNKRLLVGYPAGNRVSIFLYRTLTVWSDHGSADPALGTRIYGEGTVLTNTVTTPDTQGTTQYVCAGWSMVGGEPVSGSGSACVQTLTNDAALTWLWATNYWLATSAGTNGSVSAASGWQALGTTTQITATAVLYHHFAGWSGDAGGSANPLDLLMDRPKAVAASFAADMTASHPTPLWWLAQYGVTSNFEQAAESDVDGDGHFAWQEYVAGTVPTNGASVFLAWIAVDTGDRQISWSPDLGAARVYAVEGKTNLAAETWGATNAASRFFRVKVSMP